MSRLIGILRAAHCRSTHHYFAIDALSRIQTVPGQRLARLLLKFHSEYLLGAKAPDSSFRDFQNHVLHVADGNWGGAPQACELWLQKIVEHLDKRQWKQAAFACGVLSHYFTDPLMPLHTAQTPCERVFHRPMEWSVYTAYEAIATVMNEQRLDVQLQLAHGPMWISKAVTAGAQVAHQHYARLLEIYDFEKGCRNPPSGLNEEARAIFAELFSVAITGWARVLSRIADTTTSDLPDVSLTVTGLLAGIDLPLASMIKKFANSFERRAVIAIFDEFQRVGDVRKNLPEEVVVVATCRAQERQGLAPVATGVSPGAGAIAEAHQRGETEPVALVEVNGSNIRTAVAGQRMSRRLDSIPMPSPIGDDRATETIAMGFAPQSPLPPLSSTGRAPGGEASFQPFGESNGVSDRSNSAGVALELGGDSLSAADQPVTFFALTPRQGAGSSPLLSSTSSVQVHASKTFIDGYSPLVDAPSIGPKTAKRFEKIGISTIGDFLCAAAERLVSQLDTRWITLELLEDWQAQARLVCEVPMLAGFESQLLVAADCRSGADLASRDPRGLFVRISAIIPTSEGERILRNSKAPTIQDVTAWIAAAHHARPFSYRIRAA